MKIRAFITHKKAEHFKDCQDRFSINIDTKSVAVADGMSQSYRQKEWAEILVKTFTDNADWVPNLKSIKELSPLWLEKVREFIQKMKETRPANDYLVIWNENALALQKSAGATFCGIRFEQNNWSGDVLGDSCLIEIKRGEIKNLYTSQQGEEFDNHPDYFDSNPLTDGKGVPRKILGSLDKHSAIFIVSDPLSNFLNEKKKSGNEEVYIQQLLNIKNHIDFETLVAEWRDTLNMHNDDTTLIIIEHDGCSDFNIEWCDDIDALIADENEPKDNSVNAREKEVSEEVVSPNPESNDSREGVSEEDFSGKSVTKDEFILTGMEQYEQLKARSELGFMSGEKKPEDIVQETLGNVYELYSNILND